MRSSSIDLTCGCNLGSKVYVWILGGRGIVICGLGLKFSNPEKTSLYGKFFWPKLSFYFGKGYVGGATPVSLLKLKFKRSGFFISTSGSLIYMLAEKFFSWWIYEDIELEMCFFGSDEFEADYLF